MRSPSNCERGDDAERPRSVALRMLLNRCDYSTGCPPAQARPGSNGLSRLSTRSIGQAVLTRRVMTAVQGAARRAAMCSAVV
jgi:hypothetical protein